MSSLSLFWPRTLSMRTWNSRLPHFGQSPWLIMWFLSGGDADLCGGVRESRGLNLPTRTAQFGPRLAGTRIDGREERLERSRQRRRRGAVAVIGGSQLQHLRRTGQGIDQALGVGGGDDLVQSGTDHEQTTGIAGQMGNRVVMVAGEQTYGQPAVIRLSQVSQGVVGGNQGQAAHGPFGRDVGGDPGAETASDHVDVGAWMPLFHMVVQGERIAGDSRFRRRAFTRPEAAIGHEIDRMAWEPAGEALAVDLHGFGISAEVDQRL